MSTKNPSNREEILSYAKKKFGKCNYREVLEDAPHTYGKRFVRSYYQKDLQGNQIAVARLYCYEATGKVYFKDFLNKKSFNS